MILRLRREFVIGATVFCGLGVLCLRSKVTASPSTSPSAIHAARLKYTPPPGWIRHYLGDDRYKIDGNIWRVVSTQMDTYYHRPNCPNMLRQSADTVIGFPSGEDAIEAGYKPDPVCHPEEPVVEYGGMTMAAPSAGEDVPTDKDRPITLADGAAMTLPAHWIHLKSEKRDVNGMIGTNDIFRPAKGSGLVMAGSMVFSKLPPAVDLGRFMTPELLKGQSSIFNNSGIISGAASNAENVLNSVNVTATTLGGLRAVLLRAKSGKGPMGKGSAVLAGRGQTLYFIQDNTNGAPGVNTMMRSYRPH